MNPSLTLSNRFVMAPMGRNMPSDGDISPGYRGYFRRRPQGRAALCISEASAINHPVATSDTEHCRFFGEEALAAWACLH